MTARRGAANGPAAVGAREWLEETFGEPVCAPWEDAGPGRTEYFVGRFGLAFHQPEGHGWLFLALVDGDDVRREVERGAPVREWFLAPTDT